jgi:superfamily II DNA or RNA helicase
MELRPYQAAAVTAVLDAWRSGKRRPLLVMPTGSGKTATMAALMALSWKAKGVEAAFLVHRAELCSQTARVLRGYGLDVGVVCGSLDEADDDTRNVTVGTVQTLRLRGGIGAHRKLVLIDEAHTTAMAEDWKDVVDTHLLRVPEAKVLGATATPCRGDGRGLGEAFDELVLGPSVAELITQKHLVPTTYVYPPKKLSEGRIAQSPATAYLEHARGKRAVVFAPNVRAARVFAAEFVAAGVTCEVITAKVPSRERDSILARLGNGETLVVINVATLIEGIDVPAVECVVLARAFGSIGGYLQAVGRALRPSPGKTMCLVIDLCGNVHDYGKPEEDRVYSLEGEAIRKRSDVQAARKCAMCAAPLDHDWTLCDRCGFLRPELRVPRDVGLAMLKAERISRIPDDKRAATLARWMREEQKMNYRQGYAFARYKGFWKGSPSPEVLALAHKMLRA